MNFQKMDAALIAALEEQGSGANSAPLTVYLRTATPPAPEQLELLRRLGISGSNSPLLTATVNPDDLKILSEQPWVLSLKLSGKAELKRDREP
jgi:hypothetical protein